jgi:hypothetical protein
MTRTATGHKTCSHLTINTCRKSCSNKPMMQTATHIRTLTSVCEKIELVFTVKRVWDNAVI